jgi:hypothetical protein
MTTSSGARPTLRDLPLPAKLVVTTFLISVGLGYLWAMAQIHFKHASLGNALPTTADLVTRFSGVPWPLEPKPEGWPGKKPEEPAVDITAYKKPGVKIKTIIDNRCVRCHKKNGGEKSDRPLEDFNEVKKFALPNRSRTRGKMYDVLTGKRESWDDNMVAAFFEQSENWDKLTPEQQKAEEPKRESERLALLAWLDAGASQEAYETDRFPLPATVKIDRISPSLLVETDPDAVAAMQAQKPDNAPKEKTALERWDDAHARQLSVEHLTQSTHAHLLTFAALWALTGIVFAFSGYSYFLRCVLAPLVLVAQVADVMCWWLARLDGVGPYFALAIMGTGAVVGLGLVAQVVLSIWTMYGKKGRIAIVLLFLSGAALFGLAYVKVIGPQLQAEKDQCVQAAK